MQKRSNNTKIRNATAIKACGITFKSKLEKIIYTSLKDLGFNPKYEPITFTLIEGFDPITPFYDKETDKQFEKRKAKGGKGPKILVLKDSNIVGIRYTPDFYIRYNDLDIYIEAKGIENDVFYIKKKLFRKYLDKVLKDTGQKSLFFEVYTKSQLLQTTKIIKEYDRLLSENKEFDKNSTS